MRAELTTLEKIDAYLSGGLSPSETKAFEAEINSNPNLQELVNQQKDFVKAVNRKALRAEINAVAGGGAAGGSLSNLIMGITGIAAAGLVTASIVYLYSDNDPISDNEVAITTPITQQIDSVKSDIAYITEEENLIPEQPETIFSSINNYEDEGDEDRVNVTVHFQSRARSEAENNSEVTEVDGGDSKPETDLNKADDNDVRTYSNRSERASYPGGNLAMKKFIDRNLRYPGTAKSKGIQAVVRVDFHVDMLGKISEIDPECISMSDEDGVPFNEMKRLMNKRVENLFIGNATHVLRSMPTWNVAKDADGNSILTVQRMYFKFDLKQGCSAYQLDDIRDIE